jgi:hypothetical protein
VGIPVNFWYSWAVLTFNSFKYSFKKVRGLGVWFSGGALVWHAQDPGFHPLHCKKKKSDLNLFYPQVMLPWSTGSFLFILQRLRSSGQVFLLTSFCHKNTHLARHLGSGGCPRLLGFCSLDEREGMTCTIYVLVGLCTEPFSPFIQVFYKHALSLLNFVGNKHFWT